jgi:hypothetical protein
MSQLNFYVPDDVEAQIRAAAKSEGKTISAFLAELVKANFPSPRWADDFFSSVLGKWEGEFPEIERVPPQRREDL